MLVRFTWFEWGIRVAKSVEMTRKSYKLLIVAGESSGDSHAADLVSDLERGLEGVDLEVFGATGPVMRAVGVETIVRADDFSVVGVLEIVLALPRFLSAFRKLLRSVRERRPDAVILVDFPEFNMKFAKSLKRLGVPVIYFISPQLWAWRSYRLRGIKRDVDMLLTIFPFERGWYEGRGYHGVFYVGNPTAEKITACPPRDFKSSQIALLPGSRLTEIRRILPVMLETSEIVFKRRPGATFRIPAASEIAEREIKSILAEFLNERVGMADAYSVERDSFHEIVGESNVAAVTSGTATLETALIGTPLVVVYKSSWLNYMLLRPLISVPFFSLVNLIAGKSVATELIQRDFTALRLADEIESLMDAERNAEFRNELAGIRAKLAGADDGMNAADRVLSFLESSKGLSRDDV